MQKCYVTSMALFKKYTEMTLARDPQTGFFKEMRLGIKWMVVSKDIVDVGETISLDAQSL